MGSSLERFWPGRTPDVRWAQRQFSRAEMELYGEKLEAYVDGEVQKIWASETADVIDFAAETEMNVADHLMEKADGSAVKQQIAAARIQLMTNMNTRRISRFGR